MAYRQLIDGAMVREGGTKRHHLRLGRAISAIAAAAGVRLDSSGVSRLELALDTPARESVLPFWVAVLATEHLSGPDFGDELRDPADGLPTVWFQASGRSQTRFSLLGRGAYRSRRRSRYWRSAVSWVRLIALS
jgi:hypothetical protein